jgi:uncharacterized protein (UPF0276 family)
LDVASVSHPSHARRTAPSFSPAPVPFLGHGIGLRTCHYADFLGERPEEHRARELRGDGAPKVDWVEVITDNFLGEGGNPRRVLHAVRASYPVVFHGVGLSLGSTDPLDDAYLDGMAKLAAEIEPAWISDHLCFGSLGGRHGHDLWPLPFNETSLAHVSSRISAVQDRLRRPILVENVSSYVTFTSSTWTEWAFLSELTRRTGCGLLLDVNNVFVSAHNHGFAAEEFLAGLPTGSVGQIHLAGHSRKGPLLLDTHDHAVPDGVWDLYRSALARFGPISTLVEWDDKVPPLDAVIAESRKAEGLMDELLPERASAGETQSPPPGASRG